MFTREELLKLQNACQSKQKRIKSRLKNLYPKYKEATEPIIKGKWQYKIERKVEDFESFKNLEEKISEELNKL